MNLAIVQMGPEEYDKRFVLTGSDDELRTIWFALKEYKDILVKHATEGFDDETPATIEDEAFLYRAAGEVAQAMFDIREDHEATKKAEVVEFLNAD